MRDVTVRVVPCGDSAVLAAVDAGDTEASWRAAHALGARLWEVALDGVREIVPTYDTVLVEFDCGVTTHAEVTRAVHAAAATEGRPASGGSRCFRVPTVYGGEEGPDLDTVAASLGLDPGRVVELHTEAPLRVRCMTFPVASPLLDGADFPGVVPRRSSPRTTMPPGVVMVAGRQTALSPLGAPTGWQIIGRTPCRLVDLDSEDVAPYRAGDLLRFEPIDRDEWSAYEGQRLVACDG